MKLETPGYMFREELKWDKLRMRVAKKAWDFEERLKAGKGSGWARNLKKRKKEYNRKGKIQMGERRKGSLWKIGE